MTYSDAHYLITRAEAALDHSPGSCSCGSTHDVALMERERFALLRPMREAVLALAHPGVGVEAWTRLGLLARLIEVRAQLLESLRETFGV